MRILRSSNLNGLDHIRVSRRWCLVRTLQDPNGRELAALVDGNRLIEATVPTADELKELWASRKGKDILRKRNKQVEMLSSYPENTKILDQYFQNYHDEDDTVVVPEIVNKILKGKREPEIF